MDAAAPAGGRDGHDRGWVGLERLLRPHGGLAVAFDHGLAGVPAGLERPGERLQELLRGRPDAVLVSLGLGRAHAGAIAAAGAAMVVALDAPVFRGGTVVGRARVARAVQLAAAGAVCAKVLFQLGWEPEDRGREIETVAAAVAETEAVGLPLMVEPVVLGPSPPRDHAAELALVADGCRIAAEVGAAVLKVPFYGPEHLAAIVAASPCPVTVLGGPATDPQTFLADVRAAMGAGARGVVAGRNVWQAPDRLALLAALRVAVGGTPVATASG